jgi:hypothetical protein
MKRRLLIERSLGSNNGSWMPVRSACGRARARKHPGRYRRLVTKSWRLPHWVITAGWIFCCLLHMLSHQDRNPAFNQNTPILWPFARRGETRDLLGRGGSRESRQRGAVREEFARSRAGHRHRQLRVAVIRQPCRANEHLDPKQASWSESSYWLWEHREESSRAKAMGEERRGILHAPAIGGRPRPHAPQWAGAFLVTSQVIMAKSNPDGGNIKSARAMAQHE